eukprot:2293651-Rhodomonas_salina.1
MSSTDPVWCYQASGLARFDSNLFLSTEPGQQLCGDSVAAMRCPVQTQQHTLTVPGTEMTAGRRRGYAIPVCGTEVAERW